MRRLERVLIVAAVVAVAAGVWVMVHLAFDARQAADERARILAVMEECTSPGPNAPPNTGHACYDRGQARTAEVISQLVEQISAEVRAALVDQAP